MPQLRFVGKGGSIFELDCELPKVFVLQSYGLPAVVSPFLFGWESVTLLPVQLHALWIGLFASVVAPFGGFFASGIKRAYKVRRALPPPPVLSDVPPGAQLDDFASLIPGHGGVFDRVDCQLITGLAMGIYYSTFIVGPRYDTCKSMPARMPVLTFSTVLHVLQVYVRQAGTDRIIDAQRRAAKTVPAAWRRAQGSWCLGTLGRVKRGRRVGRAAPAA